MLSTVRERFNAVALKLDPRYVVLVLLGTYLVLGVTILGFNRTPQQIAITIGLAMGLEFVLHGMLKKKWEFPWSAAITGCGLSILLDYSHSYTLMLIPVFAAIGSKYFITFKGRHFFNPALFGVVFSLWFSRDLISAAPAYQWYGVSSMAFFLGFFAMVLFMPQINRWRLVLSFLFFYTLQIALRAWIMRHHLPFTTLFWGTLSSPPFLLFTFYMITDPRTSPAVPRTQVLVGAAIALIDLVLHLKKSYFTFFYAAFAVSASRFIYFHIQAFMREPLMPRLRAYAPNFAVVGGLGAILLFGMSRYIPLQESTNNLGVTFVKTDIGVHPQMGDLYSRLDPRIQHVAKWIVGVGDSVAIGDVDGDGLQDLFFTLPLKTDGDRCALYMNHGDFKFERVAIPQLVAECAKPEVYGLPSGALFQDVDGDGKPDLLLLRAFGSPKFLRNVSSHGKIAFIDESEKRGFTGLFRTTLGATFIDVNRDGKLDLYLANTLPEFLPDYNPPEQLNLFHLPAAKYEGDRRMFHFMHESWNNASNGGQNDLFLQDDQGKFVHQDAKAWGLEATYWSLAVGSVDFNHDGFKDLYVADDFGPDLYFLNHEGKYFERIVGPFFGSIGRDTYKGMNVSIGDVDRNGWFDIYISNVHHDLQAEGSLLWMFSPNTKDPFHPITENGALHEGALNDQRFGWGGSMNDLNNDGWIDIVQANGMVDDTIDKKEKECPDYWYVNEKIARSPPSYHSYADKWGDIRGRCIYGQERNRVYINRGNNVVPRFVDVAAAAGVTEVTNSRGMATVDLDNDGRMDIIITHMFSEPAIYRNTSRVPEKSFVSLSLQATASSCHPSAHGSTVYLDEGEHPKEIAPQMREVQSAQGFNAQSDPRLHFGLEHPGKPVAAIVDWCGLGAQERFDNIPAGSFTKLVQGKGKPVSKFIAGNPR